MKVLTYVVILEKLSTLLETSGRVGFLRSLGRCDFGRNSSQKLYFTVVDVLTQLVTELAATNTSDLMSATSQNQRRAWIY